jgi:hypothetical protein
MVEAIPEASRELSTAVEDVVDTSAAVLTAEEAISGASDHCLPAGPDAAANRCRSSLSDGRCLRVLRFRRALLHPACYTKSNLLVGPPGQERYFFLGGPGGDALGCN